MCVTFRCLSHLPMFSFTLTVPGDFLINCFTESRYKMKKQEREKKKESLTKQWNENRAKTVR